MVVKYGWLVLEDGWVGWFGCELDGLMNGLFKLKKNRKNLLKWRILGCIKGKNSEEKCFQFESYLTVNDKNGKN